MGGVRKGGRVEEEGERLGKGKRRGKSVGKSKKCLQVKESSSKDWGKRME